MDFYKITTTDGKVSLLNAGYLYMPYYDGSDSMSLNWRYLQTDRTSTSLTTWSSSGAL